jgi:adenylate cyclase class IV
MNSPIEMNLEIEYKFWAASLSKEDFHSRIENFIGKPINPFYVVSCDDYYTRKDSPNQFVRYRKGGEKLELTIKVKRNQNKVRKEINLNVSANDDISIVEFLKLSDYEKLFSVFKEAWIYHLPDCDVSYYTLSDGRSIIEVEAINQVTQEGGIEVINKYVGELNLSELEIEKRSLFEIFTEENAKR